MAFNCAVGFFIFGRPGSPLFHVCSTIKVRLG